MGEPTHERAESQASGLSYPEREGGKAKLNPPVGIILCRDADRTFCEYVLQEYQRPMGVATYRTSQEQLRELLPDEEEMKQLMGKTTSAPEETEPKE